MFQDRLENIYKKYVFDTIGADIYYDPPDVKKSEIPRMYYKCLNYGLKKLSHQIKPGWETLNRILIWVFKDIIPN